MDLQNLYLNYQEKTVTDKVLAKETIEKLRNIIKKDDLSREDYLEILYLLTSDESKLLYLSEWERYILAKFFTWIRDFTSLAEKVAIWYKKDKDNKLLAKVKRSLDSTIKFLVDLFDYISRTSLSKKGYAFDILTKYRTEYTTTYPITTQQQQIIDKSIWKTFMFKK